MATLNIKKLPDRLDKKLQARAKRTALDSNERKLLVPGGSSAM